jgi:hypothetical protein
MELIMKSDRPFPLFAAFVPALVTLAAFAAACSPKIAPPETTPPVIAPSPSIGITADVATERLSLQEHLAREATSRPAGGLRAEDVAAALGRGGIVLGPAQQVLARTIGARFCLATHSAAGLGVSICEFRDAADAAHGLAASRATFDRLIPNRRLEANRATVLTLTLPPTRPPGAPAAVAEATRAAAVFASL